MSDVRDYTEFLRQHKPHSFEPCKVCNQGTYGGIFMTSCDNPECKLYNSFVMDSCGICKRPRRNCSC